MNISKTALRTQHANAQTLYLLLFAALVPRTAITNSQYLGCCSPSSFSSHPYLTFGAMDNVELETEAQLSYQAQEDMSLRKMCLD